MLNSKFTHPIIVLISLFAPSISPQPLLDNAPLDNFASSTISERRNLSPTLHDPRSVTSEDVDSPQLFSRAALSPGTVAGTRGSGSGRGRRSGRGSKSGKGRRPGKGPKTQKDEEEENDPPEMPELPDFSDDLLEVPRKPEGKKPKRPNPDSEQPSRTTLTPMAKRTPSV